MTHINFGKTELTLLKLIARQESDEDELAWRRFFDLYYPAMLKYAELFCDAANAEDIVQKVLIKLVDILRSERSKQTPHTSFRAYLKTLIRNEFINWRRREGARGAGRHIRLDGVEIESPDCTPQEYLDADWRVALRFASIEHVLTQTMLGETMCRAYREHVLAARPAKEVAAELGVPVNYVYLAKSRVNRRVAAIEELYGE